MFQIVDVVDWRTKDETREHDAYGKMGLVLFRPFPNCEFTKFLSGTIAHVRVLCLASIFNGQLFH